MSVFFEGQAEVAAQHIEAAYQSIGKMSDDQRQQIEVVLASYSVDSWSELVPKVEAILGSASRAAAMEAIKQVSATLPAAHVGIQFDAVNDDAAQYASDRAAEFVGMKWVDGELIPNADAQWAITDSTREWLREEVQSAFTDGLSPAQLGDAIRESQAFSKSRAQMIAHTEIGNANMATAENAAIKFGATHKRSFLSSDHDHDDVCDDAAGAGEVPIDYVYPSGALRPLYHPRCECSESYYVRKGHG